MLLAECKKHDSGYIAGFFDQAHDALYYEGRGILAGMPFLVLQKTGRLLLVRFGSCVYGMSTTVAMEIRVVKIE